MTMLPHPSLRRSERPVLITGGCGFIGCNLADALASRGKPVIVLDDLSRPGTEHNANWLGQRHPGRIKIELGDVRSADALRPLVARASAVLHLAAQVAVTTSLNDPLDDFAINAGGTLNVLEAVRRHNPRAPVLFASTNKVYGKLIEDNGVVRMGERYVPLDERLQLGVDESAPLDFYSPYGCSKGAADQYVRDYARIFGLRTAVMRMSCIYGPRQFGNEDQGWIAHFLLRALQREPITIYGDGYQVRDALFVEDAVSAWLAVLDNIDAVSGSIFNLGGGGTNAISLRELLAMMAALRGEAPLVDYEAWRPGDQRWYVTDTRRLSAAVGWSANVPVRQGVAKLDHWLQELSAEAPAPRPLREARA
jgi:CDP-paratose 2-epimerase